jgi:quinoprotein glucose dehydrogenase
MSKMGLLFILDRVTGKPIHGVEERAVPSVGALPGEVPSPTQPFPVKPPALARNSFSPADIATVTPEHEKFCRGLLELEGGAHYGGPYTLYSQKPSVIFPSSIGGGNWNPLSYDPRLGYLFVNTMDFGSFNKMVPAGAGGGQAKGGGKRGGGAVPRANAPPPAPWSRQGVNGANRFWDPATNLPCNQPPWGRLFAINVHTGDIAWETRLGITESLPAGQQLTGRPNLGGSMATASGLVFIGATDDSRVRAFDSKTGKELWVAQLDAGAHSAPITYRGKDGRQYVTVVATGGGFLGDKSSADAVVTFALPK